MRGEWVLLGGLLAGALAVLAVAARTNYSVAVPLATFAVAVGGLLVVLAVIPSGRGHSSPSSAALARTTVREWLRSGGLGHEEIVRLLDRLDRQGAHPHLSVRSEAEMARFRTMPHDRFLALVLQRLEEIEGPS